MRATDTHQVEGIKVSADEARDLAEKSQDVWHWREVDLRDWAVKRVAFLFKGRQMIDTADVQIEIHKTEVYGEAFATSRKGNTEATCNLDCRIYWRGKLFFNGGVAGTAAGTIKFPEVVASCPPEEWPMKILADGEDASAMRMLNPCGSLEETALRELESYELKLREQLQEQCADELRALMAKMVQDMKAHAAGEPVGDVVDDKEGQLEDESGVSEKVRAEVTAKMEQMRVDALPCKFKDALDSIQNKEAPTRLELSCSRITDTEVAELVSALKGDTTVERIDLAFNQITDVGIQTLVTALAMGAAKGLQELVINNNNFGDMGKRMVAGASLIRKGLKVTVDSSV